MKASDPFYCLGDGMCRPLVRTTVTGVLVLWSGFQYVKRSIFPQESANKSQDNSPQQFELPLAIKNVPVIVRRYGLRETHSYPYASWGEPFWHTKRVPTRVAWRRYPEVELHSATARTALVLDCDSKPIHYLGVALGSAVVRCPNYIVTSPITGNGHVVYCLARPVLVGNDVRPKPLFLLGRIAEFYLQAYGADPDYRGVMAHNPVHPRYRATTTWLREEPWTLEELAADIPRRQRAPVVPEEAQTAEGRNSALFQAAMREFGKPRNWEAGTDLETVLAWVEAAFERWYGQHGLTEGWHRNECMWIAKSVVGYCRRNLASGQTQKGFSRIQAARGRKSGAKRREDTPLETDRMPWVHEGVSRSTWYRRRKKKLRSEGRKPWEAEGISRRTWYRRGNRCRPR